MNCIVHEVAKSRTQLSNFHFQTFFLDCSDGLHKCIYLSKAAEWFTYKGWILLYVHSINMNFLCSQLSQPCSFPHGGPTCNGSSVVCSLLLIPAVLRDLETALSSRYSWPACCPQSRLQTGIGSTFRKPQGTGARIHFGWVIMSICSKLQNKEHVTEAPGRAKFKFSGIQKIYISKRSGDLLSLMWMNLRTWWQISSSSQRAMGSDTSQRVAPWTNGSPCTHESLGIVSSLLRPTNTSYFSVKKKKLWILKSLKYIKKACKIFFLGKNANFWIRR